MQIAKLAPVDVGVARWRTDRQHITVVVKATFALDRDGPMSMAKRQVPLDPGPPNGGVFSDFVPDKVGVDVVLQGAAHAAVTERKLPLGLRVGHFTLPVSVSAQSVRNDLWQHAALGETFDYTRFNAAPPVQRVEHVAPGTPIVLTNLLAGAPLRRVWVPSTQPCLFHADSHSAHNVKRVPLRCDTLVLDTEQAWCSICWRGRLRNTRGDDGEHLIVSLESSDLPQKWADLRDSLSSATWEAAREVSDWTSVDTTRKIPSETPPDDDEETCVRDVTAPVDRFTTKVLRDAPLKGAALPFRAAPRVAPEVADAPPITPAPALPPLHLQFAAALDDGADDEPLVDPQDRLSGTKTYVRDGPLPAPLPFAPAPEGAAAPPGSALAHLPPRDGQGRMTQLIDTAPARRALPFDGDTQPTARKPPRRVTAPAPLDAPASPPQKAIIAHNPLAQDDPPAVTMEAQSDAIDKPAPAPMTAAAESLPIERYVAVKADLYDETRPLGEVLDQHGVDELTWRANERRISIRIAREAAAGEHGFARSLRESIAKLRAAATGHVAGDDGQLSVEEYAMVRAEVEESADAAATLEELEISRERWGQWRREWSRRCLRDRQLARRFTAELARARKAVRSTAVD